MNGSVKTDPIIDTRTPLFIGLSKLGQTKLSQILFFIMFAVAAFSAFNQFVLSTVFSSDIFIPLYDNQETEHAAATLRNQSTLAVLFALCVSTGVLVATLVIRSIVNTKTNNLNSPAISVLLTTLMLAGVISIFVGSRIEIANSLGVGWPTYWVSQGFLFLLVGSTTCVLWRNNFDNLTREWLFITASVLFMPLYVVLSTYAFSMVFDWPFKDSLISGCEISFVLALFPPFLIMAYNKQSQL